MIEEVIVVDELDNSIGTMEKMEAHEKAILHRAFSVFVFNKNGEMLLQQRAINKYHSGGLWTNTCCSHPKPFEKTIAAAARRLKEEMGFETDLVKVFDFIYKAPFSNGLTEYEFDHVYIGLYNGTIMPNKDEVANYEYITLENIEQQLENDPSKYTEWFKIAFPNVKEYWVLHKITTDE